MGFYCKWLQIDSALNYVQFFSGPLCIVSTAFPCETFMTCMCKGARKHIFMLTWCMKSVTTSLYFMCILCHVCYQEFPKLANRLLRKDVKDDEHFVHLLRWTLPVLTNVIPSDIMPYLLSRNVIRLADFFTILMAWQQCIHFQ